MGSWIWLGGCLLGLLGAEWAQRRYFPGESPLRRAWQGRTRRQESEAGDDPVKRTVPRKGAHSLADFAPSYGELVSILPTEDPALLGIRLRKLQFESDSQPAKAVYGCLLAEVFLLQEDRDEAHRILEETGESLRRHWNPRCAESKLATEFWYQVSAIVAFQEGQGDVVRRLLQEARSRIGGREWMIETLAEVELLEGKTDRCRTEIARIFSCPMEMRPEGFRGPNTGLRLVEAESYLRDRNLLDLEKSVKRIGTRQLLSPEERAVLAAIQIESFIMAGTLRLGWRCLGGLHRLVEKYPRDPGLKRLFHLSCARLHLTEGDLQEAHRRIQMAENEAKYPVAKWEVRLLLGMILEAEERMQEASSLWAQLASEAQGTYYGFVAKARATRFSAPSGKLSPETLMIKT